MFGDKLILDQPIALHSFFFFLKTLAFYSQGKITGERFWVMEIEIENNLQQEAARPNEVTVANSPNRINVVVFHLIREPLSD